jgi:hypothetical protein
MSVEEIIEFQSSWGQSMSQIVAEDRDKYIAEIVTSISPPTMRNGNRATIRSSIEFRVTMVKSARCARSVYSSSMITITSSTHLASSRTSPMS